MKDVPHSLSADLDLAKKKVKGGFTAVCAKGGAILCAESGRRLGPVYAIFRKLEGKDLAPLGFADKVLGLAAFRIAYLFGARAMWGETASNLALAEGKRRGVPVFYENLTPAILNADRSDLCPMEKLSSISLTDEEFLKEFASRILTG